MSAATEPANAGARRVDRAAAPCARAATVALGLAVVAQLGLAVGLLPITMAWGGRQSVLTPALRAASLAAIPVLLGFVWVLRRRAGLGRAGEPVSTWLAALSWLVTAFLALNTLGNLASSSWLETVVFAPLTAIAAACGVVISASRPASST